MRVILYVCYFCFNEQTVSKFECTCIHTEVKEQLLVLVLSFVFESEALLLLGIPLILQASSPEIFWGLPSLPPIFMHSCVLLCGFQGPELKLLGMYWWSKCFQPLNHLPSPYFLSPLNFLLHLFIVCVQERSTSHMGRSEDNLQFSFHHVGRSWGSNSDPWA